MNINETNMPTVAYVVAVLTPFLMNTRDISVRLGPLDSLSNEIKNLPDFPQDAFLNKGYHKHVNKGVYVSKNLRDFIYHGKGDHEEEGFYMTLDFETSKLDPPNNPEALAYFLHPKGFNAADERQVDKYIQTLHKNRRGS